LARDVKILMENGFTVDKIQPVDMFPHTTSIETVCLLERKEKQIPRRKPVNQKKKKHAGK
ncbi:MAG TPA: 23S rRNA (uracil(1939)-C(5))-methyltransferase RlmD, partial [Ruminococcus sp.]|nr:23S rRNA (uracil(1939)-C(5))-methyltransferase RlmD [Ruminococcus sp.]